MKMKLSLLTLFAFALSALAQYSPQFSNGAVLLAPLGLFSTNVNAGTNIVIVPGSNGKITIHSTTPQLGYQPETNNAVQVVAGSNTTVTANGRTFTVSSTASGGTSGTSGALTNNETRDVTFKGAVTVEGSGPAEFTLGTGEAGYAGGTWYGTNLVVSNKVTTASLRVASPGLNPVDITAGDEVLQIDGSLYVNGGSIIGNASLATNLNASALASGTVPLACLPSSIIIPTNTATAGQVAVMTSGSTAKYDNLYGTNISARAMWNTNAWNGVVIDARYGRQRFVTNASFTMSGFSVMSSGLAYTPSIVVSNSAATNIVVTGPVGAVYFGSASTNAASIPAGKSWAFGWDIESGIFTNAINCGQQ